MTNITITNLVTVTNIINIPNTNITSIPQLDIPFYQNFTFWGMIATLISAWFMWSSVQEMKIQNKQARKNANESIKSTQLSIKISLFPILQKCWEGIEKIRDSVWDNNYHRLYRIQEYEIDELCLLVCRIINQNNDVYKYIGQMNYIYLHTSQKQKELIEQISNLLKDNYDLLEKIKKTFTLEEPSKLNEFMRQNRNDINAIFFLRTLFDSIVSMYNLYTFYYSISIEAYNNIEKRLPNDINQYNKLKYYFKKIN